MPTKRVDLVDIFQNVTQALAANQQTLDQADDYNHNHGSNMVQTFQTVTNALEKKRGASASSALGYAAKTLARQADSGSSQLYAQHLAEAAAKFKGKRVNEKGALDLLQTLIGAQSGGQSGGQSPSQPAAPTGGDDMLGSLLGGLLGGQSGSPSGGLIGGQSSNQPGAPAGGDDMIGSLLGGLMGGQSGGQSGSQPGAPAGGDDMLGALLGGLTGGGSSQSSGQQGGFNLQNLLQAGMAYMQASQGGASTMQALVQAFVAGSGMGNARHRSESTQVVVSSFLQALGAQTKQR